MDPFAEPLRVSGAIAKINALRYSGKYTDDETGFVYFGGRYLVPPLGRWLNRDPFGEGGGINPCEFALNNPLSFFDSLGMEPMTLQQALAKPSLRWMDLGDIVLTPQESQMILRLANRSSEIALPDQIRKETMSHVEIGFVCFPKFALFHEER